MHLYFKRAKDSEARSPRLDDVSRNVRRFAGLANILEQAYLSTELLGTLGAQPAHGALYTAYPAAEEQLQPCQRDSRLQNIDKDRLRSSRRRPKGLLPAGLSVVRLKLA